jgi:hypothetical protein
MLRGRGFTSWIPGVGKQEEEKGHVRTVFPPSPPEPQTATQ